jgi:hypothetical protein
VEAPDPRPADARLQETAAWDASACAHPDVTADAVRLEVRRPSADVAEKLVGRAPDVLVPDAMCRRSAPPAVPEAEPGAAEPCTPDEARFAERSCAAQEAQMQKQQEAQPDAAQ